MEESTWKIYGRNEINENYRGPDKLIVIKSIEGEGSTIGSSFIYNLGGLLLSGKSGAIFNGVDYCKYLENPLDLNGMKFNEKIEKLERLLLAQQEVPA